MKSVRGDGPLVAVRTPGILSCNEYRWFWVRWGGGAIEVGQGHIVGAKRFIILEDPEPISIHSLTVSAGFGAEGNFNFNTYEGKLPPSFPDDLQFPIIHLTSGWYTFSFFTPR